MLWIQTLTTQSKLILERAVNDATGSIIIKSREFNFTTGPLHNIAALLSTQNNFSRYYLINLRYNKELKQKSHTFAVTFLAT